MRGKFSLPYVDIQSDVSKDKFILKIKRLKSWLCVFLFLWQTKKQFTVTACFVAPLKYTLVYIRDKSVNSISMEIQFQNYWEVPKTSEIKGTAQQKLHMHYIYRPVETKEIVCMYVFGGERGSLSKNVSQFGQLAQKIVQLKSFKMPRNT